MEMNDNASVLVKEEEGSEQENAGSSSDIFVDNPAETKDGGTSSLEVQTKKKCCSSLRFGDNGEAQGYALVAVARGVISMSNIFLATALLRLASESVGCVFDDNEVCNKEVYGFKPGSLITMIAVVSGILSAFLLPIIGAVVDFTPHRRLVGMYSALFITVVQAIQIWLNTTTWFPMLILQAINGFMYMVQGMAVYAYLPDIGREVGVNRMTSYSALFTMCQFGSMVTYLIINIALSTVFNLGDVATAQMAQGICVIWLFFTFIPGWRKMSSVLALHERPAGKGLVRIGFSQVWRTAVGINKHYGSGLRWFFLAVVFSESAANTLTVVAVTFSVEALGMTGSQVGIVFLVTLISSIPGSKLGEYISQKTSPITSWKINLIAFATVTAAAAFVLAGPEQQSMCYLFGGLWGAILGWLYPLENAVFALSVPKGQESELSGFYSYCRAILTWLPPLVFTIMNESGIEMKWGVLSLVPFIFIGLFFLQLMMPWEEVLRDGKGVNRMITFPTALVELGDI